LALVDWGDLTLKQTEFLKSMKTVQKIQDFMRVANEIHK
jgi:hypothetical protein